MDTFDITSSSVYFHSRVLSYFKATSKHLLCSFHYFLRTKPLPFIIHVNEAFTIIFLKQFQSEPHLNLQYTQTQQFCTIGQIIISKASLSMDVNCTPWRNTADIPRITVSRGLRKEHNWLLKSNPCMKKIAFIHV